MDKKKAVGYVRVSDEKLLPNDTEKQTTAIEEYVEHSDGYELIKIYTDNGTAREGGNNLESFERMLLDAESHKFERIIVTSMSRLTRDTQQLKDVLEKLHNNGIEVVFIKENITTTDMSFTIARVLESAEKEMFKVRVVGYARIGVNSVASIETEHQVIMNYVAKEGNWELCGMYADEGQKGKAKRYCFEQMLKDAEEHKFDIVVVKNFRRFCRNGAEAIEPLKRLTAAEIPVFFINEGISSADEEFKEHFSLICAIEEKQRELKSMIKRKKKD